MHADPHVPLSFLQITADDMGCGSVGCYGNPAPGITPNIDRLAREGMRFTRGHVTTAACQPSRQVWMTGRYPHRNGAMGFEPISKDVPTLQERLHEAGYLNGIAGKVKHLRPEDKFFWDFDIDADKLGFGRDPARYYDASTSFLRQARQDGRPFFFMANAHDPHRPFAGSLRDKKWALRGRKYPAPGRTYSAEEIEVPHFLPDLPRVRAEIAMYSGSVHRADETVGAVLRALDDSGLRDSTVVWFMSDHGMSFPFAKSNCYLHSTNVPWIVRWPGRTQAGAVNDAQFVSGIDFMPTILDLAGLPGPQGMDGSSYRPLLEGRSQDGRDEVYTVFTSTSAGREYPMRCLQNRRFGYVFNAWADGKRTLKMESHQGPTYWAMRLAALKDPGVAARMELLRHRVPEELYDFEQDPGALANLVDDESHAATRDDMRAKMMTFMESVGDPLLDDLRNRPG